MSRSQHVTEDERQKSIRQAGLKAHNYAYEYKGEEKAPSYGRVIDSLSDDDIIVEIERGRGEPGYQEALRLEVERRGIDP